MAVSKQQKNLILEDLKNNLKKSKWVSFTKSNALTVDEFCELRACLREVNAKLMLAKKTLIKIAMKQVYDVEMEDKYLSGQIWVLFSFDDELAWMSKAKNIMKEIWAEKISWASSYFDWIINDEFATKKLASLPPKETLLSMFVGTINAPTTKFAISLSSVCGNFVRALSQAKDKVESSGGKNLSDISV